MLFQTAISLEARCAKFTFERPFIIVSSAVLLQIDKQLEALEADFTFEWSFITVNNHDMISQQILKFKLPWAIRTLEIASPSMGSLVFLLFAV